MTLALTSREPMACDNRVRGARIRVLGLEPKVSVVQHCSVAMSPFWVAASRVVCSPRFPVHTSREPMACDMHNTDAVFRFVRL